MAQEVTRYSGMIGLNVVLEIALVVFTLVSFTLLLTPDYRAYSYLVAPGIVIPSVSVYVDAENEPSTRSIPAFSSFLRQYLDGRRADLMFFTEASKAANGARYKLLARYGFRPIDVPHDPTGVGVVKEAVDRELAMHAFERALLGPKHQEFIIVTQDGDYVPLVYRLCALGHKVQIWASTNSAPYSTLATYLDMDFVNLSHQLSDQGAELSPAIEPTPSRMSRAFAVRTARTARAVNARQNRHHKPFDPNSLEIHSPSAIRGDPGVEKLYRAIEVTRALHTWCKDTYRSDAARYAKFRELGMTTLLPNIAGVGYSVGAWFDIWIEHLTALQVFTQSSQEKILARGPAETDTATRQLHAMAKAAALTATQATSIRPDGLINIRTIVTMLEATQSHDDTAPLRLLVAPTEGRRCTYPLLCMVCAGNRTPPIRRCRGDGGPD